MIVAIDGLGVNGKSTIAKRLSNQLGFYNFNTGAIYRCIALEIISKGIDINNIEEVKSKFENIEITFQDERVILNGKDVTKYLRTENISLMSTKWATIPEIKEIVRKIQKDFLETHDTVIEGRDICTRIAPNADVKFYLFSDFETRVQRLWNAEKKTDISKVRNNLKKRDELDLNDGNFVRPIDAIEIDTTNLSLDQVYYIMINEIKKRINI